MRHEFHENRGFLTFFILDATIVRNDIWMFKLSHQFTFILEFVLQTLIFKSYDFNSHLWWKISFFSSFKAVLISSIHSLIHTSKRSFTQQMSTFNCLQLLLPHLVYLNYRILDFVLIFLFLFTNTCEIFNLLLVYL